MSTSDLQQTRARLLFGTTEPVAPPVPVAAGPLSADFVDGGLRYIRWNGHEMARAISFIARDTRWGTHRIAVEDIELSQSDERFEIRYRGALESPDGSFAYKAAIQGTAGGRLAFAAEGTSASGFRTNRTGFVVLHPLDGTVGRPLTVETAARGRLQTRFPDLIDPGIPATDIRALIYEPLDGVRVVFRFAGEAFEMEDHRNWTDASFKTYVRPLAVGFPYGITPAEPLSQAVTLEIEGLPAALIASSSPAVVSLAAVAGRIPACGLFAGQENLAASLKAAPRLADLHPAFVTGRLDLRQRAPAVALSALADLSGMLRAPLALEAVIAGVDPAAELTPLAAALAASAAPVHSLLVVPARDLRSRPAETVPKGEADLATILAAARRLFPSLSIGGGVLGAFPELNRNRPPAGIDFVAHATQATIHDAADRSVMETLQSLPHIVRSVRAFAGGVPYRIGPATIGMPPSACALAVADNPKGGRVCMSGSEPRQRALFGAAFALGFAAMAARCGVDVLALAAPTGPFGLLDEVTGARRPLATVVAALCGLAGAERIEAEVSEESVAALCAKTPDGPVLWLANLAAAPVTVRIEGRAFGRARMLDADALMSPESGHGRIAALSNPLVTLDAYALCCLENCAQHGALSAFPEEGVPS